MAVTSVADNLPRTLFAWDITTPPNGLRVGLGGVTDDEALAINYVHSELARAPRESIGTIRKVALSPSAFAEYVDLEMVGEARQTGSGVSWDGAE